MDCLHFNWGKIVKLPQMSNLMLILLFHTLINVVNSGLLASSDSLLNKEDEAIARRVFDREGDMKFVFDRPNPYGYGNYNPPKFEIPDWRDLMEKDRIAKEERERREKEEEDRNRREREEENQKRATKNKIIVGIVVVLVFIGATVCVCIRVRYDRKRRARRNLQFGIPPPREIPVVDMQTRISHGSAIEPLNIDDHRSGQGDRSHGQIGFVPNLYDGLNNTNGRRLPAANLHDSNNSNIHDVPPTYDEAVVALQPSAPPGDDSRTSDIRIKNYGGL